jgi:hypothetical protein
MARSMAEQPPMSERKPRLIVNCAVNDLETFKRVASATTVLADRYAVRLVVSHLSRRNKAELTDPGDPYLQYSVNFASVFHFDAPAAMAPFVDAAFVEANRALLEKKMAVLRDLGIGGAFFGREPMYFREPLYEAHPSWRGPRVDHPRRSRNPVYAMCLHQPEVQALYRRATEELVAGYDELDTFYWWSNDSGAGFCWYPYLYAGANGPEACREAGPIAAISSFKSAVLDGARAGGVGDPISIMVHTNVWDERKMPEGAFIYPSDRPTGGVLSIAADLSLTYPVRYLWNPLERLSQLGALNESEPAAVICWLSDVYHRTHPDPGGIERFFALWDLAARKPACTRRLGSRLALLGELAADAFGPDAADDVVEGWVRLHEAFTLVRQSPYPSPRMRYLPTYGPVSHRWLTRPMVMHPETLSPEEEGYFLPHVFAIGDEARRDNFLDLGGYPIVDPRERFDMRTKYFNRLVSLFDAAAVCFEDARRKAPAQAQPDLEATVLAARLMACTWKTCRNWLEFAVCRAQREQRADAATNPTAEGTYQRMHQTLREEIDNVLAFQQLLATDERMVLVRGSSPEDEDTFTLSPDLQAQLTKKRQITLKYQQDVVV